MPKYQIEFTDRLLQNNYERLRKQGFNRKEAIQLTIAGEAKEEEHRQERYERV